jgi:hypothetical protein
VNDQSGPGRVSCKSALRGTAICELSQQVCCLFVDVGLSFSPQDAQCITIRGPQAIDASMPSSGCVAVVACDSDADCPDGEKCLFEAPTVAGQGSHCDVPGQDASTTATSGAGGAPDGGFHLYPQPGSVWCVGSTSFPSQCSLPSQVCCLQPASPSDGYSATCTPADVRGVSCTGLIECDGDEDCAPGTRCASWRTATAFGKRCEPIHDGGNF